MPNYQHQCLKAKTSQSIKIKWIQRFGFTDIERDTDYVIHISKVYLKYAHTSICMNMLLRFHSNRYTRCIKQNDNLITLNKLLIRQFNKKPVTKNLLKIQSQLTLSKIILTKKQVSSTCLK